MDEQTTKESFEYTPIDVLQLVGRVADLSSEILAHAATHGKDPARLQARQEALYPSMVVSLLSLGEQDDGIGKLRDMEKNLSAAWLKKEQPE